LIGCLGLEAGRRIMEDIPFDREAALVLALGWALALVATLT
jgi:hypothetical protein